MAELERQPYCRGRFPHPRYFYHAVVGVVIAYRKHFCFRRVVEFQQVDFNDTELGRSEVAKVQPVGGEGRGRVQEAGKQTLVNDVVLHRV